MFGKEANMVHPYEKRIADLQEFLSEEYPEIDADHRHLDAGTEARGYWHFGYLMALRDIVRFQASDRKTFH